MALNSTTSFQRDSLIMQRIVDGGIKRFEIRIARLLVRIFFGIIKESKLFDFSIDVLGKS